MSRENTVATCTFYVLLAAVSCYLVLFYSAADITRILAVVPDDAAYFFQIAENAASGEGFTFDRINETNGFQPLWLYILIPVYLIYRGTPETMFRVFMIFQTVLLAVSALIIYNVQSRLFPGRVVLACCILFLVFVFLPSVNGMESAVLVLMLSVLFALDWGRNAPAERNMLRGLGIGLIAGLVVLSRLDMIFLIAAILVFYAHGIVTVHGDRRARAEKLVAFIAGSALVVAPYLIYNRLHFGSVMPVSGALKSGFPAVSASLHTLSRFGVKDMAGIFLAFAYLGWFTVERPDKRSPGGRRFTVAMAVMSSYVVMHFLHTILFMRWAVFRWHFIPYSLFGVLVISEPLSRFFAGGGPAKRRVFYWVCIAVVVILGVLRTYGRYNQPPEGNWTVESYRAALWVRENTGTGDIFAMKDAGNFGYFSRRRTINLDGVVNNMEYQDALKEKGLKNYLERKQVRYLVQHAFWDEPRIISGDYETYPVRYTSRKYMVKSDEITLGREDEIYRSQPYYDGPHKTVFIIWQLSIQ